MTRQEQEIATIKERTLKLKLSDADCERISKKAGKHGLTVAELLENFIGDLTGGSHSNGSDERDYADQWFERCWFGMYPENTLLHHLLSWGYEPEEYINALDSLVCAILDKKNAEEHPEEYDEWSLSDIEEEIEELQEEIEELQEEWEPENEPNMDEEIATIKKWLKEMEELKG